MDEVLNDKPIEQTEVETQETVETETEVSEQSTTDTENGDAVEEKEQSDDFSLDIKFNKQKFSLNREDAVKYAQMGKKLEAISPTLKELEYLAASDGKTLKEFVTATVEAIEAQKEEAFREKAGDDEEIFQALLAKDKADRGKAYDEMISSQKAEEEQHEQDEIKALSTEFNLLKKQVPEFQSKQFEEVPDRVIEIRNENKISLYDAYLRYNFENERSRAEEIENQKNNSDNSTGEVNSAVASGASNWEKELMKGIWGN